MKTWKASFDKMDNYGKAKYVGEMELKFPFINTTEVFSILDSGSRLIFGGACNVGFIESGYIEYDGSMEEALQELNEELETFYLQGKDHCSRIVCNERM